MPVSFATLQLAKEYVNNEYPHLKIFQQMAVIKNEYCMLTITVREDFTTQLKA